MRLTVRVVVSGQGQLLKGFLRGLLLRHAVECAQSENEVTAGDADDLAIRE
jgi:hypothetical protein